MPTTEPANHATIDMADMVNPPLVYKPVDSDIPKERIYGKCAPNPQYLKKDQYELASAWCEELNKLLQSLLSGNDASEKQFEALFVPHCAWRDHYGLSWKFRQLHRVAGIKEFLEGQLPEFKLADIQVNSNSDLKLNNGVHHNVVHEASDSNGAPIEWLEVLLRGKNKFGSVEGMVRLVAVTDSDGKDCVKALNLYTALDNITGNEEKIGKLRPKGVSHGQHKGRTSWLEHREKDFEWGGNKHPTVLIVGGGQGGLNTAARLKMMGIDSLIVEKNKAIGDNWRNRYKFLVLHDPVWYDHLAYIEFPESWPIFTPKDKLGDWFEAYAKSMELSYWTGKTVSKARFFEDTGNWEVSILDNNSDHTVTLKPKYIVMSTGHSGEPNIPKFKNQEAFKGKIIHSSQHETGTAYQGQNAVVVGCCNSGHDIAHDFYEQGAKPTVVQRSSTCVIRSDAGLKVTTEGLYHEDGFKTQTADMMFFSMDTKLLNLVMQQQCRAAAIIEKDSLKALEKAGFKADFGYGGTGLFGKYFRRGGGYYIDVGCSKLIADGKINMKQGVEIDSFTEDGVKFTDGTEINNLAIVVLATGYSNMKDTAKRIFGDEVASKLNPVWGLDEEGEINTMFRDSGHPNFFFMGGNLAISRFYSKKLALRIVAQERGFVKQ